VKSTFAIAVVIGLLLVPGASAQSFIDQLAEFHFEAVQLTVGPSDVTLEAQRTAITGDAAQSLRACLDDRDQCPQYIDSMSAGNKDGTVSPAEVDAVTRGIVDALSALRFETIEALKAQLADLVRVDEAKPQDLRLATLRFDGAAGPVSSRATIYAAVAVRGTMDLGGASSHHVQITRAVSDLNITNHLVVAAAHGWTIDQASIQPQAMQKLYADGRLQGDQSDFESSQPLAFDIHKTGAGAWIWWLSGGLLLLLVAAGVAWYLMSQRKA